MLEAEKLAGLEMQAAIAEPVEDEDEEEEEIDEAERLEEEIAADNGDEE